MAVIESADGLRPAARVSYLDSLRGLAALQVLLLHFLSAFMPGLVVSKAGDGTLAGALHASPLFFLYDGYSAVYIFFGLSGYVLTRAFAARIAIPGRIIGSRVIRLGVPAAAACAVAFVFVIPFGGYHIAAGQTLGSAWLSLFWQPPATLPHLLRDGLLNSLFLGYQGTTPLDGVFGPWLQPLTESFSSPLWTLSIEFYGSLIILALVWVKSRQSVVWAAVVLVGSLYLLRGPFICFIAGHLMAVWMTAERAPRLNVWLATGMVLLGVGLCVMAELSPLGFIQQLCGLDTGALLTCTNAYSLQKTYGALLVFFGLTQIVQVRTLLGNRLLGKLGKLSFPIYLIHWPVLFGLSAFVFISLYQPLGIVPAKLAAMVIGLCCSFLAAILFAPVDRAAIGWSRRLIAIARPRSSPGGVLSVSGE
jgi:peptidoglycan/LPS O-acetylase OafA/YrhL